MLQQIRVLRLARPARFQTAVQVAPLAVPSCIGNAAEAVRLRITVRPRVCGALPGYNIIDCSFQFIQKSGVVKVTSTIWLTSLVIVFHERYKISLLYMLLKS